jgi:thiol-disulfide isomerase/thioredoxin
MTFKKPIKLLPLILIVLIGIAGFYGLQGAQRKVENLQPLNLATNALSKTLSTGAMAGFIIHADPKPIAAFTFVDANNAEKTLADWQGKVVLLNLWATWCTPCRKEMPDLAKLQKSLGSADFEVVALSIDRKGIAASKAFLAEIGIDNLALYVEPTTKSLQALQAIGLPATILINRNGMELGRLLGSADWSAPEVETLIKAALALK